MVKGGRESLIFWAALWGGFLFIQWVGGVVAEDIVPWVFSCPEEKKKYGIHDLLL